MGQVRSHRRLAHPQRPCSTPPPGPTWVSVPPRAGSGGDRVFHPCGGGNGAWLASGRDQRSRGENLRVLTTDPGTGIMRHVDAGYGIAVDAAKKIRNQKYPMMK